MTNPTEKKKIESQLITLIHALDCAADAVLVTDLKGNIVFVNHGFIRITGYSRREAIGNNPRILSSGKTDPRIYKKMWDTVFSGKVWKGELVNKKKNGDFFDAEMVVSPVKGKNNTIVNFIGVQRNITKRKKTELKLNKNAAELEGVLQKLKKSEKVYRALIEKANDGIIKIDREGRISIWNKEAKKMFGYMPSEILGKKIDIIIPSKYRSRHNIMLEKISAINKKRLEGTTIELEGIKKNGSIFPIELSISIEKSAKEIHYLAIIRDITKRKVMEEQLVQSEKLQSIGHLAVGIAHEINNPLSIMEIDLSLMQEKNGQVNSVEQNIYSLRQQLRRIAGIVRGLQDVSRPMSNPKEKVDIHSIFDEHMMKIAFKELKKNNINVELSLGQDVGLVEVSKSQIIQVFLNMIKNSEDAIIEKKEKLSLGGVIPHRVKPSVKISTRHLIKGNKVVIEFKDTGIGIEEKNINNIFDPFFTTKGVKGTGLGLPISYSIIKSFGGEIKLKSIRNKGTTFKIYLPLKE